MTITRNRLDKTARISIDIDYYSIDDVLQEINRAWLSIPSEYRDSAILKLDSYTDSSCVDQWIEYSRPETDREMNERIKSEERYEASKIAEAKRILGIE